MYDPNTETPVKKVIMLPRYVADQFPSRYQAAKQVIVARLERTALHLKGMDFDLPNAELYESIKQVPCQTFISQEQDRRLKYLLSFEVRMSLSELVREALNYQDDLGKWDAV